MAEFQHKMCKFAADKLRARTFVHFSELSVVIAVTLQCRNRCVC